MQVVLPKYLVQWTWRPLSLPSVNWEACVTGPPKHDRTSNGQYPARGDGAEQALRILLDDVQLFLTYSLAHTPNKKKRENEKTKTVRKKGRHTSQPSTERQRFLDDE